MKKLKFIIGGTLLFLCIAAVSMFFVAYAAVKTEDGKICEGVYVDNVYIGGMTDAEALTAIQTYVDELAGRSVQVQVAGTNPQVVLSELGFTCEANNYVEQALELGKKGNIVKRFKELQDVKNEQMRYTLAFSVDEKKVKKFVKQNCAGYTKAAKNAGIKRKNGVFVYTDAKPGQKVDVAETVEKVKANILENKTDAIIKVDAVVVEDLPAVDKENASLCKDKIGAYSTAYSTGAVNRSKNLANAASLIDGTVVYPGEIFSVYETISPLDETNGYYDAPSYANGEVVDSLGGGVCQVSTTLYNAVLRAELEVVERSPHSMVVSYVEPSMDAAIAGTYKDFKFKNNTDAPIYIMGGASGGTIYFTIYGHELRAPDRTISFESEIIETIEPGEDKVTYDKTKPESYLYVTQSAHTGYKAKLWKVITENGETEKIQVNTSTYKASPRYVIKGAKKDEDKDKDDEKDKSKDKNSKDKGAKETATPKPTRTPKGASEEDE